MAVTLADGRRCIAWVYLYNCLVTENAQIASGDFLASIAR